MEDENITTLLSILVEKTSDMHSFKKLSPDAADALEAVRGKLQLFGFPDSVTIEERILEALAT